MFIELFRKTNSFKQLHVAFEENSYINILFCHNLEGESRYIWLNECLPDPKTTTSTSYPTTTEAPTTYPTKPSVTPTTVDPDGGFVCPHGGNDLFPQPGHCNKFYLCEDGYPTKMYIFVSGRHLPDFIGVISHSAAQNNWYRCFVILNRTVLTGLKLTHRTSNASKVATSSVNSSLYSRYASCNEELGSVGHLVPFRHQQSLKYQMNLVDCIQHPGNTVYFARWTTLQLYSQVSICLSILLYLFVNALFYQFYQRCQSID